MRTEGTAVPARQPAAGREAGEAAGAQAGSLSRRRRSRDELKRMSYSYRNGVLHAEEVALDELARRFGTPSYVYSRAAIASAYGEFSRALSGRDSMICYSVKANSNLAVLALLARLGAGF